MAAAIASRMVDRNRPTQSEFSLDTTAIRGGSPQYFRNTSYSNRSGFLPTSFTETLSISPPPVPPSLLRWHEESRSQLRKKDYGRAKVLLRVCPATVLHGYGNGVNMKSPSTHSPSSDSILRVEENRKQVTIFNPDSGLQTAQERVGVSAPKVYTFDSVFPADSSQAEVNSAGLVDVIHALVHGADGAVFCYGQTGLGKTYSLIGSDTNGNDLGLIPCGVSWLFRFLNYIKEKTQRVFHVRVSAIEVHGRSEKLKDLLRAFAGDETLTDDICVVEDPIYGIQIRNRHDLPVSTVEEAAYLLDAALAARSKDTKQARRHSHLVFTVHLHQSTSNQTNASGERKSKLHFIDLGSCERKLVKNSDCLTLSLNSLGHVIMAILNNSKHIPFKESKLTLVLQDLLGNFNCRTVMLAHIANETEHYADTLSTVQMASRIHRSTAKKKNKSSHRNTADHAIDHHIPQAEITSRSKMLNDDCSGMSSSIGETSGSEMSCDTVIYVRPNAVPFSDRELTDNEGPPKSVPILHNPSSSLFDTRSISDDTNADHSTSRFETTTKKSDDTTSGESNRRHFGKTASQPKSSKLPRPVEKAIKSAKLSSPPLRSNDLFDIERRGGKEKASFNKHHRERKSKIPSATVSAAFNSSDMCHSYDPSNQIGISRQQPSECESESITTHSTALSKRQTSIVNLSYSDVTISHPSKMQQTTDHRNSGGKMKDERQNGGTVRRSPNPRQVASTNAVQQCEENEVEFTKENDDDSNVIMVNFYCLHFNSKNPLVPISKCSFSKELQRNRRNKFGTELADEGSFDTSSGTCMARNGTNEVIEPVKQDSPDLSQEKTDKLTFMSNDAESRPLTSSSMDVLAVSSIESDPLPKESETTAQTLPSSKPNRAISQLSSSRATLYDSSTLVMDYMNWKSSQTSSTQTDSKNSSTKQLHRNNSKRATETSNKSSQVRPDNTVVISGSGGNGGAQLSIVKGNGNSSTLELVITSNNATPLANPSNIGGTKSGTKPTQIEPRTSRTKSKWGIKGFSTRIHKKRNTPTATGGRGQEQNNVADIATGSSSGNNQGFVCKLLSPKVKRSSHSNHKASTNKSALGKDNRSAVKEHNRAAELNGSEIKGTRNKANVLGRSRGGTSKKTRVQS